MLSRAKALFFDNIGVVSRAVGYAFQNKSLVFDNVGAVFGEWRLYPFENAVVTQELGRGCSRE